MNRKQLFSLAAFVGLLTSNQTFAQGIPSDLAVIEKRNAATVFVSTREQFAFSLVRECTPHLATTSPNPLGIVTNWYERNFPEIEASLVWLNQYFTHLRAQNQQTANATQQAFLQESSRSLTEIVRVSFGQRLPTADSCRRVLLQFASSELDFANIGKQPAYAQFGEFSQTLREYKAGAGYNVPSNLRFGVTESQLAASQMVASLIAADAARKAKDSTTYIAAYRGMALQGDGRAAQTLGISYLNGDLAAKDAQQAYRWFYAAFQLQDYEGANALGVMHRDGLIAQGSDRVLAQASFAIAAAAAQTNDARARALNNFNRLDVLLTATEKLAVGCTSLGQLDEAYKRHANDTQPLVIGASIRSPDRKIRDAIPASIAGYRSDQSCTP